MFAARSAELEASPVVDEKAPDPPAEGAGAAPAVDKEAPAAAPAKGAKPRHIGRKIALGVGIAVLVVLGIALFWGLSPTEPQPYDEGLDYDLRERNTLAYGAMSALGITDPVVAMRLDNAVVSYDLMRSPANEDWTDVEGDPVAPDDMQRGVIGAIAEAVPDVERLVVEQRDGGTLRQTWDVLMADVRAFFDGTLTFEEFERRIVKT